MTSRNLFFKLMKEDAKRKLWAVGLSFLAFFFWMPVMAAMQVTELHQKYERWIANGTLLAEGITAESRFQTQLSQIVLSTIGMENALAAFTIATAALVMALTGFMYLHSKKQMDFYHSIPVRRELIFAAKYLNGILIVLSTYLINSLLTFLVLGMNGVELSVMINTAVPTFLVHAAGYLMIYGLMTIAVVLTGNFFISILGGIVLFAYVPAIIALVQGMMYMFFETVNLRAVDMDHMMLYGSPISYYVYTITEGIEAGVDKYGTVMGAVAISAIIGVIFAMIAVLLYKKRPSESAGKSMAFTITKAPIKIMLVVPITICMSILLWNIYYSLPWAIFGFVFGLVVTHCFIEIIYHFEFRKLFSNLHHMAISAAIAVVVIAVFRFDLVGYDSYLPEKAELKGASICANGLEDWIEYGLPKKLDNDGYSWNYIMEGEYIADHMSVTDKDVIFALAETGIQEAKKAKVRKYADVSEDYVHESVWTSMEVGFQLSNGKTKYRNYYVNMTELRDMFDQLYATEEYKAGVSPVMSYTADSIVGVYDFNHGEISEVTVDKAKVEAILCAYKEEYTKLTLEERIHEAPVTAIRLLTKGEYEYLQAISHDRTPNYTGAFRIEDMNMVNFFPVYPSYEKTLALLAECGVDDLEILAAEDVLRIEIISSYMEDAYEAGAFEPSYYEEVVIAETKPVAGYEKYGEKTITLENNGDTKMIELMEEVLQSAVDLDLARMNNLQPIDNGLRIQVYKKDVNEGKSSIDQEFIRYVFPFDQIPEFVNEQFDLKSVIRREVNTSLGYVGQ